MKKNIIIALTILVIGFAVGLVCRKTEYVKTIVVERDTTVVVDTHIVEKPVPFKVTVTDTLLKEVTDTVRLNDTLYVRLPLEKREYRRDEFYAVIAGYEPRLIHMEVYPKTVYVTERVTSKEKLNSLSAGIEAEYLNTFSLPVKVTYTRNVNSWFAVYGYGEYDLLRKRPGGGMGGEFKLEW